MHIALNGLVFGVTQGFPKGRNPNPQGTLAMSRDILGCHDCGGAPGMWWVETREAAPPPPPSAQDAPHQRVVQPRMSTLPRRRIPGVANNVTPYKVCIYIYTYIYIYIYIYTYTLIFMNRIVRKPKVKASGHLVQFPGCVLTSLPYKLLRHVHSLV